MSKWETRTTKDKVTCTVGLFCMTPSFSVKTMARGSSTQRCSATTLGLRRSSGRCTWDPMASCTISMTLVLTILIRVEWRPSFRQVGHLMDDHLLFRSATGRRPRIINSKTRIRPSRMTLTCTSNRINSYKLSTNNNSSSIRTKEIAENFKISATRTVLAQELTLITSRIRM